MKCFPNNKPYITKEIKDCIHRKKLAFARRDRQEVKRVQKELNTKLREENDTTKTQWRNISIA